MNIIPTTKEMYLLLIDNDKWFVSFNRSMMRTKVR